MKGTTHLTAGTLIGISISFVLDLNISEALPIIACSGIASMVPDIDSSASRLGRLVGPGSFLIQLFIGHRTFFHAPLPYAAVLTALWLWQPSWSLYLMVAVLGILSHLFLDSLNPMGIPLFWPYKKRFRLDSLPSGGIVDRMLGIVLFVANIFFFAKYIDLLFLK